MKSPKVLRRIAALCAIATASSMPAQSVPMVFDVPVGADPSQIWIQFLNTSNTITGFYHDTAGNPQSLAANTAYSLAQITSPVSVGGGAPANAPAVNISSFDSGRVYVNYGGSGLSGLTPGYQPDAANSGDANYTVRYQYFEPTIAGAQANVDLSYIDFFAISMSMTAVNAPNAQNSPQISTFGQTIFNAVAASGTTPNNNVLPNASAAMPSASFARVIAPQLDGSLYHDWSNYLQTTLPGKTANLKGIYVGTGAQPSGDPTTQAQSYDFTASFAPSGDVMLAANPGSGNGTAPGVPVVQQGPGIGDAVSISIAFSDLNAITGIYGNNPPYTVTVGANLPYTTPGIENDVFGRVVGDLMAGLSFGFVGSTVLFDGVPIGDLASTEWWGGTMPDGTVVVLTDTPAGQNLAFGAAQPGEPENYHTYAGALQGLTPAYGFALQDRENNNLLTFNTSTDPNSYLLLTINPDPVPEPAGFAALAAAALAALCGRRRRAG